MNGLVIFPGGFKAAGGYVSDPTAEQMDAYEEAEMMRRFRHCEAQGHLEHTCPACGDRSCLRCGVMDP